MKKLSLLLVVFLFFAGCSKDNMTSSVPKTDQSQAYVPHLDGMTADIHN